MQGMRVDPVFIAKGLWCSGDESILSVDQPGDIVGNASGGIGCVRPPFKNRNVHVRLQSPGLGRRSHAGCIAAYHYELCHCPSPVAPLFPEAWLSP